MNNVSGKNLKRIGRVRQTGICLGKLFRMFVFQSDWKVIPMAAVITEIVAFVVAGSMNKTMEGTVKGAFALSCICIWNGFFNSIQVVCRERAIVKREHRSGLHMSAYIAAHMIYQAFLCACQCIIIIQVLNFSKVKFPESGLIFSSNRVDIFLTLFLVTFAADMIALFVSCLVKNPTTAMTIVPFMLIIQLVFAGTFFNLKGAAAQLSEFTISKWGIRAVCSEANYNELPMSSVWTTIKKMRNVEYEGSKPVQFVVDQVEAEDDGVEQFTQKCGEQNPSTEYLSTSENVADCWGTLIGIALLFAGLSVISLEFIDKDKR